MTYLTTILLKLTHALCSICRSWLKHLYNSSRSCRVCLCMLHHICLKGGKLCIMIILHGDLIYLSILYRILFTALFGINYSSTKSPNFAHILFQFHSRGTYKTRLFFWDSRAQRGACTINQSKNPFPSCIFYYLWPCHTKI